jgi:hypothetical protein
LAPPGTWLAEGLELPELVEVRALTEESRLSVGLGKPSHRCRSKPIREAELFSTAGRLRKIEKEIPVVSEGGNAPENGGL